MLRSGIVNQIQRAVQSEQERRIEMFEDPQFKQHQHLPFVYLLDWTQIRFQEVLNRTIENGQKML